jgi:hypothetical protein
LIIGQNDHVLSLVAISLNKEGRHVVDIVDTTSKLSFLIEVVDANQKSLATTGTVGILESIAFGGSVTELLGRRWRRWAGSSVLSIVVLALWETIAVCVEAGRRRV